MPTQKEDIERKQSRLGVWMFGLGWVLLIGLGTSIFTDMENERAYPNRDATARIAGNELRLELTPDRDNHYLASGTINGQPATFLLDTGATTVSIPDRLKAKFLLSRGEQGWAYTANGRTRIYSTRVDSIDLGGLQINDVEANLNPGMDYSDVVLLGMSALSQFNVEINDGQLSLIQPRPL